MKYEILKNYKTQYGDVRPSEIRIIPENTDVRQLFAAMVQSAYEMDGTHGLGGLATLNEPASISKKEAARYILYDSKRSLTDRFLKRPDTRVPKGVRADYIRGRAVKLDVYESKDVSKAYEMSTHIFVIEVGSIDKLFESTQEKLQ